MPPPPRTLPWPLKMPCCKPSGTLGLVSTRDPDSLLVASNKCRTFPSPQLCTYNRSALLHASKGIQVWLGNNYTITSVSKMTKYLIEGTKAAYCLSPNTARRKVNLAKTILHLRIFRKITGNHPRPSIFFLNLHIAWNTHLAISSLTTVN